MTKQRRSPSREKARKNRTRPVKKERMRVKASIVRAMNARYQSPSLPAMQARSVESSDAREVTTWRIHSIPRTS